MTNLGEANFAIALAAGAKVVVSFRVEVDVGVEADDGDLVAKGSNARLVEGTGVSARGGLPRRLVCEVARILDFG